MNDKEQAREIKQTDRREPEIDQKDFEAFLKRLTPEYKATLFKTLKNELKKQN